MQNKNLTKIYATVAGVVLMTAFSCVFAFADALSSIQNLSDFLWTILKLVGMIMIGFGLLQTGLSIQAQDSHQRMQGILFIVGGILVAFAQQIVNLIVG